MVEKLQEGGYGLVRSATINTKNGLTSRPITKLNPIEVTLARDCIDNNCDDKFNRTLEPKSKCVAIERIKKWTNTSD